MIGNLINIYILLFHNIFQKEFYKFFHSFIVVNSIIFVIFFYKRHCYLRATFLGKITLPLSKINLSPKRVKYLVKILSTAPSRRCGEGTDEKIYSSTCPNQNRAIFNKAALNPCSARALASAFAGTVPFRRSIKIELTPIFRLICH